MKTTMFTTSQPTTTQPLTDSSRTSLLTLTPTSCPLPEKPSSDTRLPGEAVRHILLGSPGAIRQTIHLLHSLRYAETVLWSPVLQVEEPLMITPAQGEAMSLLRRKV